ncbi:unnamed protein product [Prunus armeniaca]|uniref:Uncharacterized protein n=1 Tax=Prunus armeniaca TaxID=36596 RepID=A0A6J5UK55_PRUAR|nr:unnamed protein product [Prunus armeniaca]
MKVKKTQIATCAWELEQNQAELIANLTGLSCEIGSPCIRIRVGMYDNGERRRGFGDSVDIGVGNGTRFILVRVNSALIVFNGGGCYFALPCVMGIE